MPQLEFSTWISQIFWLIISFTILYLLMSSVVLPRIQSISMRRQQKISGDLKRADKLSKEAEDIIQEYTEALQTARTESALTLKKALQKAEKEQAEKIAKFNESAQKRIESALAKITAVEESILKDADSISEEIAQEIFNKITSEKVK